MMSYDDYYGVAVAADDGVRLLANSLRHALSPFILSALPVPMLRQVYVEPCEGPSWAPLGFARVPPGPPWAPQSGDFAWEVCKKREVSDVNSTS